MVVDAAIHQIAHHEVVLDGHQSLGMNGQLAIGGQGQGRQDPFEIQLSVLRSGAVAVSEQVIQTIAVKLAAHQLLHQWARCTTCFQQLCHRSGGSGCVGLQAVADPGVMTDDTGRPFLMPHAEHFLAGVAQRSVSEVMQQG